MNGNQQFHRAFPLRGEEFDIWIDGVPATAREGQSVLTVLLAQARHVRRHETNSEPRAGFCLMGACQDCWVWLSETQRGRSCTTPVEPGMRIFTTVPVASPAAAGLATILPKVQP